jgi:uncharacterized membrane protein YhaH (DUF805 family)
MKNSLKINESKSPIYGRSNRKHFLYFHLIYLILGFIFSYLAQNFGHGLIVLYFIAFIIGKFFITIRRIRDIGISGWFYLLIFIPILGGLFYLSLFFIPTDYFKKEPS